jgi:hypothetical protein
MNQNLVGAPQEHKKEEGNQSVLAFLDNKKLQPLPKQHEHQKHPSINSIRTDTVNTNLPLF